MIQFPCTVASLQFGAQDVTFHLPFEASLFSGARAGEEQTHYEAVSRFRFDVLLFLMDRGREFLS